MKCHSCQFENPIGARFCGGCGAACKSICAGCGAETAANARFCHHCGVALAGSGATGPPAPVSAGGRSAGEPARPSGLGSSSPMAERRHLTVMFCDLVGSTALSAELDPEDLGALLHQYQELCEAMVQRFDGHIAQFLGDGILVYFGYPQAHEDDAHRAIRAGLAIIEALAGLNERQREQRPPLRVRVGIHTGTVVIGESAGTARRTDQLALGETPNVAARIQNLAEPNAVLVSGATYRLAEGFFDFEPLPAAPLKGLPQNLPLYKAVRETTARSRLEVIGEAGWTPLVGREEEMALLLARWERVTDGMGEVVVLTGEGGIGKSRLVQTLVQHAAERRQAWLTPLQCSPYHQSTALYPMIDFLNRVVFQFEKNEPLEHKWSKIEGLVLQYGLPREEAFPLLTMLVSLPLPAHCPPLALTAERQKHRTLHTLEAILLERAARQPLLFLVEDLHWIDPTTLELLSRMVDQVPTRRIFALYTCRPEFAIPWKGRSHVTQITVTRLSPRQIADMIGRLTRGKRLPQEVFDQIVRKTDGVPLFVEELTKMVLESGFLREHAKEYLLNGPLPALAIPTTLQDSLTARLDRLATIKDVAQLCSVLGREFSYELLQAVSGLEERMLQRELAQLIEAELLYQRGTPPHATYIFKHALIQEAAYQSLLKSKRQQHHQRIAQALRDRFAEIVATQPELIAHHCTEGGQFADAVRFWRIAGERAGKNSNHPEAIAHLTRGLDLLEHLPESGERDRAEIGLRLCLGPSLTATKGYGSNEVERTYARARVLCEAGGDASELFLVLYGLWRLNMLRAQHRTAKAQGGQLLQLASDAQKTPFLVAAHRALAATSFYMGEFDAAGRHVAWVLQSTARTANAANTLIQDIYDVVDPRVTCRSYHAWNLWLLGEPAQARAECEAAIALAETLQHPFSIALALSFASWLYQFLGDIARTRELSHAAVTLAEEQGFLFWIGWGKVLRGWADSHGPDGTAAIAEMRAGLAEWHAQGSKLGTAYFLTLLADALLRHRQVDAARAALADADRFAGETDEHYWLAERHRVAGEVALAGGDRAAAERFFAQAREVAMAQHAKSLELRAATSLAQLRRKTEHTADREVLLRVLGHFTEGLETRDLQAARTWLDAKS